MRATQKTIAKYQKQIELIVPAISDALKQRGLKTPVDFVLETSEHGEDWLFAVMGRDLGKVEHYKHSNTLHQISTYINEALNQNTTSQVQVYVGISNTTGFRYGILLSPRKPYPEMIELPPDPSPDFCRLGWNRYKEIRISWKHLGMSHIIIGGLTRYGKSNGLRVFALQFIAQGWPIAVFDFQNRTLPQLEDATFKFAFGKDPESCMAGIDKLYAEYIKRENLFKNLGRSQKKYPDDIFAYNKLTGENLPPIYTLIDEWAELRGAISAEHNEKLISISRLAAKYGLFLVMGSQVWNKDTVGDVGTQADTRICFKVKDWQQSKVVSGKAGAEAFEVRGRALTNLWDEMQFYYVPEYQLELPYMEKLFYNGKIKREGNLRTGTVPSNLNFVPPSVPSLQAKIPADSPESTTSVPEAYQSEEYVSPSNLSPTHAQESSEKPDQNFFLKNFDPNALTEEQLIRHLLILGIGHNAIWRRIKGGRNEQMMKIRRIAHQMGLKDED